MAHLLKIHKYIFQDIYYFAGKIREESIIKGNTKFCESQFIKENLKNILNELKAERYLIGKGIDNFANRSAYYMAELNFIHPFREGNGRALREFIRCLGIKCGYIINWDAIDKDVLLSASILSVKDSAELANCIRACIEKE
ncbi:Fic/DOC family protein [Ruminiclostridium herbifermentans]|uniref:Fic/DOC family protein n=1 Tax=Ruminiclostridium herbifermentans TaxID=2488810 RepID=UPI002453F76F|nr:Fic family protein [Ruminiclostridium herbifermentans]